MRYGLNNIWINYQLKMKIAIHRSPRGFSLDWIDYCKKNNIEYGIVDCLSNDIINQLKDFDVLLWHHHHASPTDQLLAKQLLFALEQSGKKVFPDFGSGWHFDDKLGQKYLLEAIGAPLAPYHVFYDESTALKWVESTDFPKVFKLRGGAGSRNVRLVKSKRQAKKLVNKAFGRGFPSYDKWGDFKENFLKKLRGKSSWVNLLKSFRRIIVSTKHAKVVGRQKGYILFQDFIPNNKFDIRVVVIGARAFAIKRLVRKNDFRASGSGTILYGKNEINEDCVKIAFETSNKLRAMVVAYDFVFNQEGSPLIIEINYGYAHKAYFKCPGYWDKELNWYEGNFNSADWILEEIIKSR